MSTIVSNVSNESSVNTKPAPEFSKKTLAFLAVVAMLLLVELGYLISLEVKERKFENYVSSVVTEKVPDDRFNIDESDKDVKSVDLSQGRHFYVREAKDGVTYSLKCTIGYVDKQSRQLYTAKHCGNDGQLVYVNGLEIGQFSYERSPSFGADFAVINVYDGIVLGDNFFSGDEIVNKFSVSKGDEVCLHSAVRNITKCGNITDLQPQINRFDASVAPVHGDSGGVMWIPDKGFLGVAAAFTSSMSGIGINP